MRFIRVPCWLKVVLVVILLALPPWIASLTAAQPQSIDLAWFEGRGDVGIVKTPGAAEFDAAKKELRMTASGANIWDKKDDMYFAWRKVSGDLVMTADISFIGKGKDPHRKAGWMVREGLDTDAANAGVSVHGDGLIILHYRKAKGGITYEVKSTVKLPATVKLERHGDIFSVSAAKPGGEFQPVGAVTAKLQEPVHAGIFLCAHDNSVTESASFTNLGFQNIKPGKKRVQETSLEVMSVDTGERKVIYKAREKFEAPNWSRDGKLYFNKGGAIYTVPVSGGKPIKLDTGDATNCNNDHGLSPDGKSLVISHNVKGASQISIVPSTGGAPKRLTNAKESCYWHGWSPDGKTLAYVGQTGKTYNIFTMPVEGGPAKQLTTDSGTTDGPDYTPDGKYIYFNSDRTGDMRIWRMNADGSSPQQITKDANYSDWFPHPSPDGKMLVWLSFDKSIKDHPPNKDVVLRMTPLAGGKTRTIATLFGGQGTINVPSWSPDSKQIAFVSYIPVLP